MLAEWLKTVDSLLWGNFLIFLLVAVGLLLTWKLRGMQFRFLLYSLKLAFSRQDPNAEGDISQFQSLMTALAATIGIGSIAGVATAIVAGGFGAIFWMWMIALLGMATKFAEALLAVKYRETDDKGEMRGGPMYYIAKGLGWKKLGGAFAVFGTLSAFAGGNLTQSHSIAAALHDLLLIPPLWTGISLSLITGFVLLGGIKTIGKISAYLVPLMALLYIAGGVIILILHWEKIPSCLSTIFHSAFQGQAAFGGFLGASVASAIELGASRGVSSNEAGLGSAPIAAAAAKTDSPGRQALISMTGVFLSTFIVCTITALTIGVTDVLGDLSLAGVPLNGAPLVMQAFRSTLPGGGGIVALGLILFGYSTIIGWAYYGEKCMEFLCGSWALRWYRALFCLIVFFGAIASLEVVWPLVDIMNGLMALPNLIALFALSGVVVQEAQGFFSLLAREKQPHPKSNFFN